ncbi:MAG: pilus assembly protein CpaC [Phycisphaerales bacterium]|nr:pilus assembly protein CpaC [Phycisphaerales bacterium]
MNKHTQNILKHACRWAVAATVAALVPAARGADPVPTTANVGFTPAPSPQAGLVDSGIDNDGKLALSINKTAVLTTKDKTTRVNVGQPDIAEVTMVGPTTILITAKKPGNTQVIVWNEKDQSQAIDVSVNLDIQALRDEVKKSFPDAPITVDVINGQVTLRGRVPTLKVAEQAGRLANAYTKEVINFLEVGGGQQIVLSVQFLEVNRAASNQLGFSSYFNDGSSGIGFQNGPNGNPIGAMAQGKSVEIPGAASIFGNGTIGGTIFETYVQALKQNNLARTLAEPSLVSVSGEDASFLAGGEIPIPVPQAGAGGSSTITIEYKEFGVRLKYNAVVLGNGRIRMKVEPEVSSLDYSSATSVGGQPVPGLRTRKLSNIVEMAEGQTLALAGLLQRDLTSSSSGIPGLSDLPVVGAFFRNVKYTRSETELVILVTPHLASAMNPDQVPAATGDRFRYPNEAELYGLGDLGALGDPKQPLASRRGPAPRFVGPYGFDEKADIILTAPVVPAAPITPAVPVAPVVPPIQSETVIQPTTAPADSK